MKKKLLALIAAIFFLLVTIFWFGKYTVTSGERIDSFSGTSYGYKIEKYFFWKYARLIFWSKRHAGTNSVYEFSGVTIDKIEEEKWLNNDTAIYLNLQIKYVDSTTSFGHARIIYDFHRGEIYTSSQYTLWRIPNGQDKLGDWMNNTEFDAVFLRLNR